MADNPEKQTECIYVVSTPLNDTKSKKNSFSLSDQQHGLQAGHLRRDRLRGDPRGHRTRERRDQVPQSEKYFSFFNFECDMLCISFKGFKVLYL